MQLDRIFDEFPAPDYRETQKQTLANIRDAFAAGNQVVLVQAPTGAGKSLLARAVAGCADTPEDTDNADGPLNAYYTTPQVSQIDDIKEDPLLEDIKIISGKSNYGCILDGEEGTPVNKAKCSREPDFECPEKDDCPYFVERNNAQDSRIAGMTLAYFMESAYLNIFDKRDVVVIDEAHGLLDWAELFATISLNPRTVPNWDDIKPGPLDSIGAARQYIGKLLPTLNRWRAELQGLDDPTPEQAQIRDQLQRLIPDLEWFLEVVTAESDNWAVDRGPDGDVLLKPLEPQRWLRSALWDRGNHFLLLSATLLDKDDFCYSAGLDPSVATLIDIPHTFPLTQRKLIDATQGEMKHEEREDTIPEIARLIARLMGYHSDEKGLIHCHSYDIQSQLIDYITEYRSGDRIIGHTSDSRNAELADWKDRNDASVLFSVKMEEALDLEYDLARWQVLCKAPYRHVNDPLVAHRLEQNRYGWYNRTALRTVIQACGRIVRSPDDYGLTYIADENILELFEKTRNDMPDWFADQVDAIEQLDPQHLPPVESPHQ